MVLYSYYRSSAAYRVRIALNIKEIKYEQRYINLANNPGEQLSPEYKVINQQGLLPTLIDDNFTVTQSLAIIEYLDDKYKKKRKLIPEELILRTKIKEFCQIITTDIHPLNNLRVLKYLENNLHSSKDILNKWYQHWIIQAFDVLESLVSKTKGNFCFGDSVTVADCCLVPQIYNAIRYNISMDKFKNLYCLYQNCNLLKSFEQASPNRQIDAK